MKSHRNCTICGKPVVLVPSAAERSRASGLPASYYLDLFTYHGECLIKKRNQETSALIQHNHLGRSV